MRSAFVIASAAILWGTASPALAGWGCHATGTNNAFGAYWGQSTEAAGRKLALQLCSQTGKNCHAVCKENLDTQEQFEAVWPRPPSIANCKGDAKGC
jgi:hypothetical protein